MLGLRREEVGGLRWSDLDIDTGALSISRMRAAGIAADVVAAWHGHTEHMAQAVYGRMTDDYLSSLEWVRAQVQLGDHRAGGDGQVPHPDRSRSLRDPRRAQGPLLHRKHWPFQEWGRFLPEQTTAVSILDRLLHHARRHHDGQSYRMKDAQHRKENPPPT